MGTLSLNTVCISDDSFFGHLGGVIGHNYFTQAWLEYGELAAVIGFFIISGFSIAHSIEQRPKRYLLRRFWRIWSTYLFSFFICTLPAVFIMPYYMREYPCNQNVTILMVFGNLFMLQGLIVPVMEANAATWTLAIEEWCYLLALLFKRCNMLILAVMILGSACCYTHARDFGWIRFAGQINGIGHISFLWAWLLGFFFYRYRTSIIAVLVLFLFPVWLILGANELGGIRSAFTLLGVTLIITFGERIVAPLNDFSKIILEIKRQGKSILVIKSLHIKDFFVFLGNVSYPLYIIHYPLFFLLFAVTKWHNPWIYAGSVFLLSILVYYFIDKPNRKRWEV